MTYAKLARTLRKFLRGRDAPRAKIKVSEQIAARIAESERLIYEDISPTRPSDLSRCRRSP